MITLKTSKVYKQKMDDTISQNIPMDINLCCLHKTSLMTQKKNPNIMTCLNLSL